MANTIKALRILQWGAEGVKAQGTLTMDTQPTAADTVTVGDTTYTWKASGAVAGEINRGADLAAAKLNFVAAINGTDSINTANAKAKAAAFTSNTCVLTATVPGTVGNTVVTTEAFTAGSNVFDGTTLGTTTPGSYARGTAVAATSKMAVEGLEFDTSGALYSPKVQNGLLVRNIGTSIATKHGTTFSVPDQGMFWEQLPHWLSMLKGNVIPTLTGGVYVWTFTNDPTVDPVPLAMTIERRHSDGLGNNLDQRAAYAMLTNLMLKYADGDSLKMSAAGFARKMKTNAITSALTLPSFVPGVSALSTVYMDASWGAIGGTQLASKVIGWDINLMSGLFGRMTADGRADLDYTLHQLDGSQRGVDLNLTLLMDSTVYAAEAAHADAGDVRAIQINVTDPLGLGRVLQIKALVQYKTDGLFKVGDDGGQDVVSLSLQDATDQTNSWSIVYKHPTVRTLD